MPVSEAATALRAPGVGPNPQPRTPNPGFLRRHFDFDLARLGGFLLRKGDGQYAVLVRGRDLLCIERVGNGEAADELTVIALDPVEALGGAGRGFEGALAGDGEGLVLDADVD